MSIEINNESGVAVEELVLAQLGRYVLDELHINPLAELSVVLLDEHAMAALHQQWMDLPGPTDVMAFPMDGVESPVEGAASGAEPPRAPGVEADSGPALLGDVVLCPQVATKQASEAGHSAESELHLLCVHGILHLLGYDHGDPDEEREMFELQARLVAGWSAKSGRPKIHAPLPGTGGSLRS